MHLKLQNHVWLDAEQRPDCVVKIEPNNKKS